MNTKLSNSADFRFALSFAAVTPANDTTNKSPALSRRFNEPITKATGLRCSAATMT